MQKQKYLDLVLHTQKNNKMENKNILTGSTFQEKMVRDEIINKLFKTPIEKSEIQQNLGLFINRQSLSRIIYMNELYKKIINVHGIVIEFGVRWGQNMALFSNFRGMYEPFNYNRKIVGFDSFSGFPKTSNNDGNLVEKGMYSVSENYEEYLDEILLYHEKESPIHHKKKFEIIKGDATKTFPNYIKENPQTIVAFAYFDFDIYEPTKVCLELLLERVTKGSIIAFDELNLKEFPGETIALMETIGLSKYSIKRSPLNPLISYLEIE